MDEFSDEIIDEESSAGKKEEEEEIEFEDITPEEEAEFQEYQKKSGRRLSCILKGCATIIGFFVFYRIFLARFLFKWLL